MAIRFRQFSVKEGEAAGRVFAETFNYLLMKRGMKPYVDLADPAAWEKAWERDRRSLFEHLSGPGSASWLAEDGEQIVGYARSIARDDTIQLTEYFVLPGQQGRGIGRELLQRAFAGAEGRRRMVIASTEGPALARYFKAGLFPLASLVDIHREPEVVEIDTELAVEANTGSSENLAIINQVDREILGYEREADHRWLCRDRRGFIYRRHGKPAGYGYVGRWCGPFAVLDPTDFPAVLSHAETAMVGSGYDFAIEISLSNRAALEHALKRRFHLATDFVSFFLADSLNPDLTRYAISMPAFFT
jgi:GNAT superfamily N-acetyltransferase